MLGLNGGKRAPTSKFKYEQKEYLQADILRIIDAEDGSGGGEQPAGGSADGGGVWGGNRKSIHCFHRLAACLMLDEHRGAILRSGELATRAQLDAKQVGANHGAWQAVAATFRDKNVHVSDGIRLSLLIFCRSRTCYSFNYRCDVLAEYMIEVQNRVHPRCRTEGFPKGSRKSRSLDAARTCAMYGTCALKESCAMIGSCMTNAVLSDRSRTLPARSISLAFRISQQLPRVSDEDFCAHTDPNILAQPDISTQTLKDLMGAVKSKFGTPWYNKKHTQSGDHHGWEDFCHGAYASGLGYTVVSE